MSSPTNIDFNDLIPPPKPDAFNIEWQATAPVPDPNSPGNYLRELSGCYRVPQLGGVLVLTDVYDLGDPDSGFTFVCNSATPFTITHQAVIPVLPNPQGVWNFKIINLGAGTVTLDLNGLNLDGSGTNPTYATGEGAEISTDGTDLYTCSASGSSSGGTVTSVGLSTDASFLTVGSSPVTTAGTITLNKTAALTGNQVVATPDGTTGKADLRALVAADIPNLAASKITSGQLALARGGTGVDLSATGGATKVLAQDASHVISARDLIAADIPNITESQVTSLVSDLALKAPLASPALTGTPTAPTPTTGDDSTKIATTAFVEDTIDNLVAADIPNIAESQVTNLVSDLALKAALASPALTGTPTAPTAAVGTNTTQIATTAFVIGQQVYDVALFFPGAQQLASQVFTGFIPPRAAAFAAGLAPSTATAITAATGSTVLSVQKNGSQVGTITFAIAGTSGTFAAASGFSFNGTTDVLSIVGPATPDSSLADIGIVLSGTR